MKTFVLEDVKYQLVKDYKNGFELEELEKKYTDYFHNYDYLLGDWAYGKLRLKGFCKKNNPLYKGINDYDEVETYIKQNCSYECRYFLIEKITNK